MGYGKRAQSNQPAPVLARLTRHDAQVSEAWQPLRPVPTIAATGIVLRSDRRLGLGGVLELKYRLSFGSQPPERHGGTEGFRAGSLGRHSRAHPSAIRAV
jgi:hypothetical protein